MSLVKISPSELFELQLLYEVDWPLHIVTFNTIKNFIERFRKFPEWKEKVSFWSFEGDWRNHATFIMINRHTDQVFFNTLEPAPYLRMQSILTLIPYTDTMVFVNTRSIFRNLVREAAEKLRMHLVYESVCDCYIIPKERFQNVEIVAPDGYQLKPLSLSHAAKINSRWMLSNIFPSTEKLMETCIEYNVNFGIFKDGELVAWTLSYDNGAMGVGHVIESERNKHLMQIVFSAVAATIVKEFDIDIYYWVEQGNEIPETIMKKQNLVPYDVQIGMVVSKTKPSVKSHI